MPTQKTIKKSRGDEIRDRLTKLDVKEQDVEAAVIWSRSAYDVTQP